MIVITLFNNQKNDFHEVEEAEILLSFIIC